MRSLPLFLALLIVTGIVLSVWPGALSFKGMLLLAWAALGLSRGLWMAELVFFARVPEADIKEPATLSEALNLNRGRALARENSAKASQPFTERLLIWMILAGLYGLWFSAGAFFPAIPEVYADLAGNMQRFLQTSGIPEASLTNTSMSALLPHISYLLMVAISYGMAHSFAGGRIQGKAILAVALTGFIITGFGLFAFSDAEIVRPAIMLTGHWFGYGPGAIPVLQSMEIIPEQVLSSFDTRVYGAGMAGVVYLYMLGLFQALIFVSALGQGGWRAANACLGLAVLGLMLTADWYLPAGYRLDSFWLCGWTALSVLSVHSRNLGRRSSRLWQK